MGETHKFTLKGNRATLIYVANLVSLVGMMQSESGLAIQTSVRVLLQYGDPFLDHSQFTGQQLGPAFQIGQFFFLGGIRPGGRNIPPHGRSITREFIIAFSAAVAPYSAILKTTLPRSWTFETRHTNPPEYGVNDASGANPTIFSNKQISFFLLFVNYVWCFPAPGPASLSLFRISPIPAVDRFRAIRYFHGF